MKKVLVGFLLSVSFLLTFQVVTVHGDILFYKKRFDGMINTIEELFSERQAFVKEYLWDQQEDRLQTVEENLTVLYESELSHAQKELEQYKSDYLTEINEAKESIFIKQPYDYWTQSKYKQIDSSIEKEIEDYIRQLLNQDNNPIKIME